MCVDIKKIRGLRLKLNFQFSMEFHDLNLKLLIREEKKKRLANLNREKPKNIENKKVVKLKQYWDRF